VTYQVLTRKWRPQVFQEIVGQDHIIRTLTNAISLGRINHAYLFAGPHGTGKTSTARILAKALNCDKGPTPLPCNRCSNCLEITRGESLDVLEIDGASNRGIDEVRELRERIGTSPMKGRFKVYIIDEVHMLTHPAFNALLKTLEEPPSHAIFIFATTDPEKVPPTIISRCQRFDFRKIRFSDIVMRLEQIVKNENISATPQALQCIAIASENSMRDAEKILDQLISYTQGEITEKDVIEALGMVEAEYLANFTDNLYHHKPLSNIKLLHKLLKEGKDPQWIVKGWLNWLRDITMLKLGEEDFLTFSSSYKDLLKKQSSYFTLGELTDLMENISSIERKIRFSSTPNIHLEVLMVKLCSLDSEVEKIKGENPQLAALYERIVALEQKLTEGLSIEFPKEVKEKGPSLEEKVEASISEERKPDEENEPSLSIPKIELTSKEGDELKKWKEVIKEVKQKKRTLGSFLEKMKVLSVEENSIVLGSEVNFLKEVIEKRENKKLICEELKKFFSKNFSLKFKQITPIKTKKKESVSLREIVAKAIEIFEGEVISK